jgi:hypothetical protein
MKSTPSRSGKVPRGQLQKRIKKKAADENENLTF